MKKLFISTAAYFSLYTITVGQPPIKKLVFTGHRYEYERVKREGEIILSDTDPYDMTKAYKQFRQDSTRIVQDSLSRQSKKNLIKGKSK